MVYCMKKWQLQEKNRGFIKNLISLYNKERMGYGGALQQRCLNCHFYIHLVPTSKSLTIKCTLAKLVVLNSHLSVQIRRGLITNILNFVF